MFISETWVIQGDGTCQLPTCPPWHRPWTLRELWGGYQAPSLLHSRHSAVVSQEELSLLAQDRQPPAQSPAALVKNCFLPLREYFKYFSAELTSCL